MKWKLPMNSEHVTVRVYTELNWQMPKIRIYRKSFIFKWVKKNVSFSILIQQVNKINVEQIDFYIVIAGNCALLNKTILASNRSICRHIIMWFHVTLKFIYNNHYLVL